MEIRGKKTTGGFLEEDAVTVSTVSPSICHEVIGPDDLSFLNVEF